MERFFTSMQTVIIIIVYSAKGVYIVKKHSKS